MLFLTFFILLWLLFLNFCFFSPACSCSTCFSSSWFSCFSSSFSSCCPYTSAFSPLLALARLALPLLAVLDLLALLAFLLLLFLPCFLLPDLLSSCCTTLAWSSCFSYLPSSYSCSVPRLLLFLPSLHLLDLLFFFLLSDMLALLIFLIFSLFCFFLFLLFLHCCFFSPVCHC